MINLFWNFQYLLLQNLFYFHLQIELEFGDNFTIYRSTAPAFYTNHFTPELKLKSFDSCKIRDDTISNCLLHCTQMSKLERF